MGIRLNEIVDAFIKLLLDNGPTTSWIRSIQLYVITIDCCFRRNCNLLGIRLNEIVDAFIKLLLDNGPTTSLIRSIQLYVITIDCCFNLLSR